MSDLEATRDHARKMAAMTLADVKQEWRYGERGWGYQRVVIPPPTDSERALWRQIADEIDAYLAPKDDGPGLFGEAS